MIDISEKAKKRALRMKDLSELARKFITELNGEPTNFQVEEIILSDDQKTWIVTVSYYRPIQKPNDLQKAIGLFGIRAYKKLEIENKSYEVIRMSDWAPESREAA